MREDRGAFGGTRQIASDVASSEVLPPGRFFRCRCMVGMGVGIGDVADRFGGATPCRAARRCSVAAELVDGGEDLVAHIR